MIAHHILQYRLDLMVFAVLIAGGALLADYIARRCDLPSEHPVRRWVWSALFVLAGGGTAEFVGHRAQLGLQESAMSFASTYAYELERMGHAQVDLGTPPDDARYLSLVAAEKAWLQRNPGIADIYTCRRLPDGRFVYIVDAEADNDPRGRLGGRREPRTPIGKPCFAADEYDVRAAQGGAGFDSDFVTDEYGVWVRALQPMFDAGGRVEAVLGVDISAGTWLRSILMERLVALVCFYVLFFLAASGVHVSRQRSRLAEREQAEAGLRESENRFRSLCENIPNIAVQGYDCRRRVIFWNQASVRLYGFSREEAMGRPLETLIIPPAMRGPVVEAIARWIATGVPIPAGELVLQRKDGSPVNVFSSHAMQVGTRGEPEMYCVDIDLAERNHALAALAISEANYRTLFEVIPHPLGVYDLETLGFIAVNGAAIAQYGYSREELLRMSLRDIPVADEVPAMLKTAGKTDAPDGKRRTEWHLRKKDGDIVLVEVASHLLPWAGRRARILLAHDITARREAERRLFEQAELLDKTTEAIVVVDLDQRITFWNRGAERLFCYSEAEMRGRTLEEMLTLGHVAEASMLAQALSHVEGSWRGEVRGIDRNGRPLFIETSIAVMRNDTGQPTGHLSVSTDITKRKALEAQIVQAQKMEVLGQLAGGVAHDFNSILMAMTLRLEMLEMDLRAHPVALSALGDLKTMIQRAANLIGQLLLFARKHAMKPRTLELNAALGGVTKMLQRLLGVNITLELKGGGVALWIEADACMLDQVVLNLGVNARDAMPKGGILTIETSREEFDSETARTQVDARPGAFACLRVSDTGCGMAPEVMAHACEPFFTTKEAGKGTGLGLATVHGIVHQHQGWITMESVVGQGTTIRVYLPISQKPEASALASAEVAVKGGDETILLVEDDEVVRRLCAAMLLRFGYRVLLSADGQQALRIWDQNPEAIDLLLTDMVLPGKISGQELADRLRLKRPSLAVVLMSGNNNEIMKADGLLDNGRKFVQKPVESATLASVIRSCLD